MEHRGDRKNLIGASAKPKPIGYHILSNATSYTLDTLPPVPQLKELAKELKQEIESKEFSYRQVKDTSKSSSKMESNIEANIESQILNKDSTCQRNKIIEEVDVLTEIDQKTSREMEMSEGEAEEKTSENLSAKGRAPGILKNTSQDKILKKNNKDKVPRSIHIEIDASQLRKQHWSRSHNILDIIKVINEDEDTAYYLLNEKGQVVHVNAKFILSFNGLDLLKLEGKILEIENYILDTCDGEIEPSFDNTEQIVKKTINFFVGSNNDKNDNKLQSGKVVQDSKDNALHSSVQNSIENETNADEGDPNCKSSTDVENSTHVETNAIEQWENNYRLYHWTLIPLQYSSEDLTTNQNPPKGDTTSNCIQDDDKEPEIERDIIIDGRKHREEQTLVEPKGNISDSTKRKEGLLHNYQKGFFYLCSLEETHKPL